MGIDARDFEAIRQFCLPFHGQNAIILGDCTFHLPNMNLESFANACGLQSASTIDIAGNPTFKEDLTRIPEALHGRFGVVIDAGTLFCCLDVMAAWRGAISMLKPSGGIYHIAGMTGYFGRCYYSFSPRLFRDFYELAGFKITRLAVRATRSRDDRVIEIKPDDIFSTEATKHAVKFGSSFKGHISELPADAQIICEARHHVL